MPICEHCNDRHGIAEDWFRCQEARAFRANLDKWALDMANDGREEILARLDKYVRMV